MVPLVDICSKPTIRRLTFMHAFMFNPLSACHLCVSPKGSYIPPGDRVVDCGIVAIVRGEVSPFLICGNHFCHEEFINRDYKETIEINPSSIIQREIQKRFTWETSSLIVQADIVPECDNEDTLPHLPYPSFTNLLSMQSNRSTSTSRLVHYTMTKINISKPS